MAAAPTGPVTGIGFKLGVAVKPGTGSASSYTDLPWLTKLTKPKRAIDGAEAGTLSGVIDYDVPTRPKLTSSASMRIVEGDAGYAILRDSCKQFPITLLSFQITAPWGATKSFDGWVSSWDPSELNTKDTSTVDFDIMLITPENDVASTS